MSEVFLALLRVALIATAVMAVVLVLRAVLPGLAKKTRCALWVLVAVALTAPLLPIRMDNPLSLVPDRVSSGEVLAEMFDGYTEDTITSFAGQSNFDRAAAAGREIFADENGGLYTVTGADGVSKPQTLKDTLLPKLAMVWFLGLCAMALYAGGRYFKLCWDLSPIESADGTVYDSDRVPTPFILGVIGPRIYLPAGLSESEREMVLAHERAHIARGDHIWKVLGYALLSVYWFHPLCWVCYRLFCRDIELACDEKVVQAFAPEQRANYSQALLQCSAPEKFHLSCPLAFGEVGVKERVQNILNYKKPAFWVTAVAIVACIVTAVLFLTKPTEPSVPVFVTIEMPAGSVKARSEIGIDPASTSITVHDNNGVDATLRLVNKTGAVVRSWETEGYTTTTVLHLTPVQIKEEKYYGHEYFLEVETKGYFPGKLLYLIHDGEYSCDGTCIAYSATPEDAPLDVAGPTISPEKREDMFGSMLNVSQGFLTYQSPKDGSWSAVLLQRRSDDKLYEIVRHLSALPSTALICYEGELPDQQMHVAFNVSDHTTYHVRYGDETVWIDDGYGRIWLIDPSAAPEKGEELLSFMKMFYRSTDGLQGQKLSGPDEVLPIPDEILNGEELLAELRASGMTLFDYAIAHGYYPNYMEENSEIICDSTGKCTITKGDDLWFTEIEERPDINIDHLVPTSMEMRVQSGTKVTYDLHGFIQNIYYESDTPGEYQLAPPWARVDSYPESTDTTTMPDTFLNAITKDATLTLRLEQNGSTVASYREVWDATNAISCLTGLQNLSWRVAEAGTGASIPDGDAIYFSEMNGWRLTAYAGSPAVRFNGPTGEVWRVCEGDDPNAPYSLLRSWYDEVEFSALGGTYDKQGAIVIPDVGQDYLTAAKDFTQAFEGIHLQASSGSKFCYTFVSTEVSEAEDMTQLWRENGTIDEDTYCFFLYTAFVEENQRALNDAMAGNTGNYDGTDPSVPEGAWEYTRCGIISKRADGWHGELLGTGW